MRKTEPERFWSKVDRSGECWVWTAKRRRDGYGHFRAGVRTVYAHRWAYEALVGQIPDGLTLDHICRNRACVNPKHLEPVTHRENILRGISPPAVQARRTHCPKGHPYSGENLRIRSNGYRQCRICSKKWNEKAAKKYNKKNKDRLKSQKLAWYHANKEEINMRLRELRRANPEHYREYSRVYRRANRDRINARQRERRAKRLSAGQCGLGSGWGRASLTAAKMVSPAFLFASPPIIIHHCLPCLGQPQAARNGRLSPFTWG